MLKGAAIGLALGGVSGLAAGALPAISSKLASLHIPQDVIEWLEARLVAPGAEQIVSATVWSQVEVPLRPFLSKEVTTLIDVAGVVLKPLDKLTALSTTLDYATPIVPLG